MYAVGHTTACDPIFIHHNGLRIIKDEETQNVCYNLGKDDCLEGVAKEPVTKPPRRVGTVWECNVSD